MRPARIVPCPARSPGHEPSGWMIHEDDRKVRPDSDESKPLIELPISNPDMWPGMTEITKV